MKERFLYLAPMEGVMDYVFRNLITSLGAVDLATTEFIRVTNTTPPDHVVFRYAPELKTKSQTNSGTPLWVQILGGSPSAMAASALRIVQLGAIGIDVNFGCPAKTVNRNDGGSILLKTPDRLYKIMNALRTTLPPEISISAKMRLGFDSTDLCLENAKALEAGGACRITVHARTRTEGYRPPAHWEWITKVRETVAVPVVANGDITCYEDLLRCEQITGCSHFMIGRGVLQNAFIFDDIRSERLQNDFSLDERWQQHIPLLQKFFKQNAEQTSPHFAQARTKQWLNLLAKKYSHASQTFEKMKIILDPIIFAQHLAGL